MDNGKTEMAAMALSQSRNELWMCDNQGFVHIFDAGNLSKVDPGKEIKTVYGHPGTMIGASNQGGALMVVGDAKGYSTIFDVETREQKGYNALHKNKVMHIHFTSDNSQVYTCGFDKLSFLFNVNEPTVKRELPNPNEIAQTNSVALLDDGDSHFILAAGTDCAIRQWKY